MHTLSGLAVLHRQHNAEAGPPAEHLIVAFGRFLGTARDPQDTLDFSVLSGVRPRKLIIMKTASAIKVIAA